MRPQRQAASIRVEGEAFVVSGIDPPRPPVTLDEVQEVIFFKRDEWTTDLICCEIAVRTDGGQKTWFLHEEAPGWADLVQLLERLPGFDREWFTKVAWPAFAANPTVAFKRPE